MTSTTSQADVVADTSNLSGVTNSLIAGYLTIGINELLSAIKNYLVRTETYDQFTLIKFKTFNMNSVLFKMPLKNYDKFFNPDNFQANFQFAFKTTLTNKQLSSSILPYLDIRIENNNNSGGQFASIDETEIESFKFFTCIFFNMLFSFKIDGCSCYPSNMSELNAVNYGVGMNCISLDCKQELLNNPQLFNDIVHSDCDFQNVQAIFASINQYATGSIKNNITFDCSVLSSTETTQPQQQRAARNPHPTYTTTTNNNKTAQNAQNLIIGARFVVAGNKKQKKTSRFSFY